jgi:hypothetical protein
MVDGGESVTWWSRRRLVVSDARAADVSDESRCATWLSYLGSIWYPDQPDIATSNKPS